MSSHLIQALKKSREVRIESSGKAFIIRRPTDYEMATFSSGNFSAQDVFDHFVVGWDRFTGLDFSSTGDPDPQPFDLALFKEWIVDNPQHWQPLIDGVLDAYKSYREKKAESLKN